MKVKALTLFILHLINIEIVSSQQYYQQPYQQYPQQQQLQYSQMQQPQQYYAQPQYAQSQYTTQSPTQYTTTARTSSTYTTQPYTQETTTAICDTQSQQRLTSCASELMRLGVFTQPSVQVEQLTLNDLSRQQREYFIELCSAYNKFNQCLGGATPKQTCYPIEPYKARFAVADAALDYVCGEGHSSMLVNWECYISVAQEGTVAECESRISRDTTSPQQPINEFSQGSSACSALQNYVECVRGPIESTCGKESFETVVQALERPVHIYLPYCTLAGGAILPSLLLLTISLIATMMS